MTLPTRRTDISEKTYDRADLARMGAAGQALAEETARQAPSRRDERVSHHEAATGVPWPAASA
jgi:hypothetical protein